MNHSLSKQSGHAAILFAMIIPALFGLFTLASDGARALQTKARIQDAAEVATLAVSAHNADNTDSSGADSGSQINRDIATDFLEQYMVDMTEVSDLKIIKKNCDDIKECRDGLNNGEARFFQYEVEAKTDHKSWFPGNEAIPGFGDSFTVAGAATARKYQSEAVDVVFVADFSGSMKNSWAGGSNEKYIDLIGVMHDVSDELEKFNFENMDQKNTIGTTAYNFYTMGDSSLYSKDCYVDQLSFDGNNIDYEHVISTIFDEKSSCITIKNNGEDFNDIALSDQFKNTNSQLALFKPGGGTASFQGMIRGAQLLSKGKNSRRLMIILSDGFDDYKHYPSKNNYNSKSSGSKKDSYLKIGYELINSWGLCDQINKTLQNSSSGEKEFRFVAIGFGYDLDNPPKSDDIKPDAPFTSLADCVGENNLYEAEDIDEVLDIILELISEEIGHLK